MKHCFKSFCVNIFSSWLWIFWMVWLIFSYSLVIFSHPVIYEVYFFLSEVIPFRLVKGDPLNFTVFDLVLNPILNSCKLSTILKSLETVHIVEIIPQIMGFIDMLRELNSLSLECRFVSTANIASIMPLILYFFLGISLLCKLIDNNGSYNISKENFKKSPINQIWHELFFITILIDTLPDNPLGIQWLYTWSYRVTMLIYSVDVNIDFFIFIQRNDVIVDCHESENKWKDYCEQAHD